MQGCREHLGLHPCDRRRTKALYHKRYPGIDFSLVIILLKIAFLQTWLIVDSCLSLHQTAVQHEATLLEGTACVTVL